MSILSNNIITIREVAGMTQTVFASEVCGKGVTKGMVGSYEKDIRPSEPSQIVLKRIAEFAGVSTDDLTFKRLEEADLNIKGDKTEKEKKEKKEKLSLEDITIYTRKEITELKAGLAVLRLKFINLESKVTGVPFDEVFLDVQTKTEKEIERLEDKGRKE